MLKRHVARAVFKMDQADMRRARFGGVINAGFGAETADFYVCWHDIGFSEPKSSRHAELGSASYFLTLGIKALKQVQVMTKILQTKVCP